MSLLLDDSAAAEVAAALTDRPARISLVNVAEVLDVLVRVHRVATGDALESVGRFLDDVAAPVVVTREHGERAGSIRARHYHRRDRDVSLADCFVVAVAEQGDAVATSDGAVARVATREGVEVLPLPNALGRTPRM